MQASIPSFKALVECSSPQKCICLHVPLLLLFEHRFSLVHSGKMQNLESIEEILHAMIHIFTQISL